MGPIAQSRLERTPDKREVVGSIPTRPTITNSYFWNLGFGGVAQLGERLPCTQEAIGSNPFTSTSQELKSEGSASGPLALSFWLSASARDCSLTIGIHIDESVQFMGFGLMFVVKLLRAGGGCLGAKS